MIMGGMRSRCNRLPAIPAEAEKAGRHLISSTHLSDERGIVIVATFLLGARGNFDLPARCALRVLPLQRTRPTMKVVGRPLPLPTRLADPGRNATEPEER